MDEGASVIRVAVMDDLPAMVALAAEEWRRGPHGDVEVDEAHLAGFLGAHLVEDDGAAWVSDVKGKVRGMLTVQVGPMPVCDALAVSDTAFVCKSGEGRLLLAALNKWADHIGARLTSISVSSGHRTAGRVITSAGYTRTGGIYYRSGAGE